MKTLTPYPSPKLGRGAGERKKIQPSDELILFLEKEQIGAYAGGLQYKFLRTNENSLPRSHDWKRDERKEKSQPVYNS